MSAKPHVYMTRSDVAPIGLDVLQASCDVTAWPEPSAVPRAELLSRCAGQHALFCTLNDRIDAAVLDAAGPQLAVIATMSVGYDHIDVAECQRRRIRIGYTPDVLTDATAELTVGLLLATSRRLHEAAAEVRSGGWAAWSPSWMCGQGLAGSVVGIVGFGRIGQEVARRLQPFRPARLLFSNRSATARTEEARQIGAQRVEFDELLAVSDFVVLTCALTAETTNLINAQTLGRMKPTAILVNSARGAMVDQAALCAALQSGGIRAAGLDVTTPEPLPLDSPLLGLRNCVVLPHIGSADERTRLEMARITAENIVRGLRGEAMVAELVNVGNK